MEISKFIKYRKIIDNNRKELESEFNIKIDNIYRLGLRVSIPDNKFNVLKDYKNSELDIFKTLDAEVKKNIANLDKFFMKTNLMELVKIYNVDRTDINLVILILSFKLFDVVKVGLTLKILQMISILGILISFLMPMKIMILVSFVFLLIFSISTILNIVLFKKLFV